MPDTNAGFLQRQRWALDAWLSSKGRAHTFSLPVYQIHRDIRALLDSHARGPCLDAGSGRSPLKKAMQARGIEVISIDIEDRAGEIDEIADIQEMPVVPTAGIGTVLCTNVLEHVPRPWDAINEIARVLEPGGWLILSVPHLSAIHEAPHDYFRYTRYGLESLLGTRGLKVLEIREAGGIFSFLGHGASLAFLCSIGAVPGLRRVAWAVNYLFLIRMLGVVDGLIGVRKRYPCNYLVLAQKQAGAVAAELGTADVAEA